MKTMKTMKIINSLLTNLLLTASIFLTQQANAQAPQKMSYQSVLRNSSNVLLANTQVRIKISVLQGTVSGNAVYTETQTPTANANGLVSLQIGTGANQTGTFAGIDWTTGPYFIKTETDPAGGSNYTITGTQELLSVPYALYAKTAENGITTAQADAITAQANAITAMQGQITALQAQVAPLLIPTVTIGTQRWTATNLNITTYRDGTPIPEVQDDATWASLTTGAWCHYNNDPANDAIYGKLYNWYAVAGIFNAASLTNAALRKQFAPTGLHVPADDEWTILISYLGDNAGGKMKEAGTAHWVSPNAGANNSSGFTALPGGLRGGYNGLFFLIGSNCYWWSSSEGDADFTGFIPLYTSSGTTNTGNTGNKRGGYSVRCVRD